MMWVIKKLGHATACLLLALGAVGPTLVSAERVAPFSCVSVNDLRTISGAPGATCIATGFARAGDGGGGMFYWTDQPPGPGNDGTVFPAAGGGAWVRLFNGPIEAAWFGVMPTAAGTMPEKAAVDETTRRLQRALAASAGNALRLADGIFYVSDTIIIPGNTEVEGAGPQDVWTHGAGGTTLRPFGPGQARQWQDTGNPAKDQLRPLLVCGGSNVRLRNLGLQTLEEKSTDTRCWDVGILLPATKRCSLDQLTVHGFWQVAACLLDATWSNRNQPMIARHGGMIKPSSMNECTIMRCFLSGLWGLMIRGVDVEVRDPRTYRDYDKQGLPDREAEWLWSQGGTSDIEVISCRLEGKAPRSVAARDGGAFYSDAPLVNGAKSGQGHRIIGCNLRTNTLYLVKLGSSNRDSFVSCYFEGGYYTPQPNGDHVENPSWLANDAARTGQTRFIDCRFTTTDVKNHWDYKNTWSWPDYAEKKNP